MTNRVRQSKQRLASKQLAQSVNTPSADDTQPLGTWLNPVPTTTTVKYFLSNATYCYFVSSDR
jgi:hypothetical protein